MLAQQCSIPEVFTFTPPLFEDERGFFFESFNQRIFEQTTGLKLNFIQDNHSKSKRGTLRGLHYQSYPKEQGKLVRVVQGEIFDVAVDIRPSSPTFKHWVGEHLSADNRKQLWIPAGFAHGFYTISAEAEVVYKTTEHWSKEHERCILWNDPEIAIQWPCVDQPLLSAKDQQGKLTRYVIMSLGS